MPAADLQCSFCGKPALEVQKLIAGPGVYVCNECVDLCNDIIAQELATQIRPELDDEQALARMVALHRSREQVEREVGRAVRDLRRRGFTWTRIGEALGISKQSAWERYSGED